MGGEWELTESTDFRELRDVNVFILMYCGSVLGHSSLFESQ